jgi:hypothetical protein
MVLHALADVVTPPPLQVDVHGHAGRGHGIPRAALDALG